MTNIELILIYHHISLQKPSTTNLKCLFLGDIIAIQNHRSPSPSRFGWGFNRAFPVGSGELWFQWEKCEKNNPKMVMFLWVLPTNNKWKRYNKKNLKKIYRKQHQISQHSSTIFFCSFLASAYLLPLYLQLLISVLHTLDLPNLHHGLVVVCRQAAIEFPMALARNNMSIRWTPTSYK